MEKAFVNTKENSISGTPLVEAKKKEVAKVVGSDQTAIDTQFAKETILLKNGGTGVLLGIACDPKLQPTAKDVTITLLDDMTEVAKISKNTLIQACQKKAQEDIAVGITYVIPLYAHAISLEFRFQNRIDAQGDISGLFFYFKN